MEKNDLSDPETEQVKPEVVESMPEVKPKRKLNLSDAERAKRAENMKKVALARIEKSRAVNAQVADQVKEIHKQAIQKGKAIRMKKAIEIQHPEIDSDSDDSDDSDYKPLSSKKKRKSKQPIIIIKNYTGEGKKQHKEFDAVEQVTKLQEQFKQPEPEPIRKTIGYFV
jgi:hypothetical protein